jgi:hypothetical protein
MCTFWRRNSCDNLLKPIRRRKDYVCHVPVATRSLTREGVNDKGRGTGSGTKHTGSVTTPFAFVTSIARLVGTSIGAGRGDGAREETYLCKPLALWALHEGDVCV